MRFYATYGENGKLTAVGTGDGGIEICREVYEAALNDLRQLAQYVDQVASGAMELADVPEQYREQVAREIAAIGPEEPVQMTETETALTQMGVQIYE